jgi:hypothetical protein
MHFIVTAQYLKPVEDGSDVDGGKKKVTDKFLVNAHSVTEAEAKVTKWLPENYDELFCKGSVFFDLDSIVTVGENTEKWFLSRVKFCETTDKGKEKWYSFQVMVNGKDLSDALKNVSEHYSKETVQDYVMGAIAESKIIIDEDLCKEDNGMPV